MFRSFHTEIPDPYLYDRIRVVGILNAVKLDVRIYCKQGCEVGF